MQPFPRAPSADPIALSLCACAKCGSTSVYLALIEAVFGGPLRVKAAMARMDERIGRKEGEGRNPDFLHFHWLVSLRGPLCGLLGANARDPSYAEIRLLRGPVEIRISRNFHHVLIITITTYTCDAQWDAPGNLVTSPQVATQGTARLLADQGFTGTHYRLWVHRDPVQRSGNFDIIMAHLGVGRPGAVRV